MAEGKGVIESGEMETKRASKLTEKALENKLHRLIGGRRGVLAQITGKKREVESLMRDAGNKQKVQDVMSHELSDLLVEFEDLTTQIGELLTDEERDADLTTWVEPKMLMLKEFKEEVEKWMDAVDESTVSKDDKTAEDDGVKATDFLNDEVGPEDSVSQIGIGTIKAGKKGSFIGHSSVMTARSSVCITEEAKLAGLMERAAVLQKKQELELEEARIKAKLERLTLEAAIAEKRAQVKVLKEYERSEDGMNSYVRSQVSGRRSHPLSNRPGSESKNAFRSLQLTDAQVEKPRYTDSHHRQSSDGSRDGILQVMQKQNMITEMLVTQQRQAQLPIKDVPIFQGDPLTYRSFMRAFEQAIEQRTDNDPDKLYYLQQFTVGEPKALVCSCEHMSPNRGFKEAKRLLQKHYGDELLIANAYIDKALKWPQIKSEDGKALNTYAVFLTGCCNTMEDVEFMEEMNNPTNMRIVVSKLPYKMRERWRNIAFEIKESTGHRSRFADLVQFIDRQAKIALDPLFGELQDNHRALSEKGGERGKYGKGASKGSSFATSVAVQKKGAEIRTSPANLLKGVNAFEAPCVFCQKNHPFESCSKFKELTHDRRVEFLKTKGLCFGCLTQGHLSKTCKKRIVCKQCSRRHPDILHMDKETGTFAATNHDNTSNEEPVVTQTTIPQEVVGCTGAGEAECLLAVVPVKVRSRKGGQSIETYAFMDTGSTATFCMEELRKKLNVKGKSMQISLSTMGQEPHGAQKLVNSCMLSDLEICGLEASEYIHLPKVFTHSHIPVEKENIPKQRHLQKWQYLQEVRLPHIDAEVGLLLGANNSRAMEPWHIINSQNNGPYAVKTVLGWMVYGPVQDEGANAMNRTTHYNVNRTSVVEVERLLVQQYNADFPERQYEDKEEMSQEDKRFMQSVQKTTKYVDGHYCVGLPLRNESVKMPNNRCLAEQRANSLKKKLGKSEVFHQDYKTFMQSLLDKGYAVEVPPDQLNRDDSRIWYVPHHGVYHPKKMKIRVVFDCTASFQEVSLNGNLLQGPDLTNTLIGVLLRFREESIAMMADIESMFYQVRVPEEDADLLRFLWWPDGNLSAQLKEYRMAVHLFGATSSPSVASYALRRTAEDRRDTASPEAVETVLHNFYVDDCLKSVSTEDKAVSLVQSLQELCMEGGFNLTKWVSNSRKVLTTIPAEHRASELVDHKLAHEALPTEQALGMQWCTESDAFTFSIDLQDQPVTRRGILSMVNAIYDPLGFMAPVVLPAKLILRDLCKEKQGWDEEISGWQNERWHKWLQELAHLLNFRINRCIKPAGFGHIAKVCLHHFSDASEYAYGTVSYLVLMNEQGRTHCSFVMGKSRVAPLKEITIPRLELTAALVAVKVDKMLREEMQVSLQPSVFWTDSITVLRYIESDTARYKTFVANRINLIREATSPVQWRYVKTGQNPADWASRGMKVKSIMQDKTWINGPAFLTQPECEWPTRPESVTQNMQSDPEVKKVTVNAITTGQQFDPMKKLLQYYSSWDRLKRAVAWISKAKELLRHLKDKMKGLQHLAQAGKDPERQSALMPNRGEKVDSGNGKKTLTLEQLMAAEMEVVRYSQAEWFSEEIKALCNNLPVRKTSPLYKLDPVLQDGVLRVGGRLNRSAMPEEAKHPAILSKHSIVAKLIIRDIHEQTGHCGWNYMLSKLRQKWWIPQVTTVIRKLVAECTVCRRLQGRVGQQKMATLPEDRLLPDKPPFTNVGVDFFGPFDVKRGRGTVKRYGVLFTCLTIRAIHIEVADSLDTSSCINALRRFISRRGQVTVMRSDNGTNFVGAEKELRNAIENLNQSYIEKAMQKRNVKWIFNSPTASHQGGVWERQIRTVRRILSALLREQTLTDDSLQTLMCEVESIINSRPITNQTDDPCDLEPLTPNHLLLMKVQPNMPPGVFGKEDQYARKRWRQVQYLADLFWTRWTREYLPLLQERQKWVGLKRNYQPGDVVLVVDSLSPRNTWIMGKVIQAIPDSSGIVRRVKVQTKASTLERPINKLCLLQEAA